jgi:hypothetical protein
LKEAAESEVAYVRYILDDAALFVKSVIGIMMDESHGRNNLVQIIREMSEKTPFIVMNDYRIAYATNSVKRVEVMINLFSK